jgi:Flp pilus assembly pilin Flp
MAVLTLLSEDESGVTAIEYRPIEVAAIGSFTLIDTDLGNTFATIGDKL